MATYKGTNQDGQRASALAKAREKQKTEFDALKESMQKSSTVGLRSMDDLFASKDVTTEAAFKVGNQRPSRSLRSLRLFFQQRTRLNEWYFSMLSRILQASTVGLVTAEDFKKKV